MSKSTSAEKHAEGAGLPTDARTPPANPDSTTITHAKFWLLEAGTAKKLGLRSTGGLSYLNRPGFCRGSIV
jgi:hypothetical protein